jgi:N-acetylglucosaminyldiphosphoundecaprenol N-acetyl-beta-D-mannosaminyltransferase
MKEHSMNVQPFEIGGIKIDNLTFAQAVEHIISLVHEHRSHYVVTPNADHIVRLREDAVFLEVYQGASVTVADGITVVLASKLLGHPLKERVTGSDLLPSLCARAAEHGFSIYLLGAPPGVAQKAADNLKVNNPKLIVAGVYSPPLGFEHDPEECQRIIDQINQCKPDIVFVGLGSPKQELWIGKYRDKLNTGVLLGVGAAIAFTAGTEKRAPLIMQKLGLEWLHRLIQDPRRLAARYWKDTELFVIVYRMWRQKRKGNSTP